MEKELLDQRLQLVVSKRIVETIDNWRRYQPNIYSRSEAIRLLIQKGLDSEVSQKEEQERTPR